MAFVIKLTNGSVLTTVQDYAVDTTTSLNLIGRGVANYGQIVAENFVHLLENSAYTSAPAAPLRGQLWYNTVNDTLEIYDGSTWHNLVTSDSATNQTITLTGDATGSGTSSIPVTLTPPAGLTAGGTHSKITYNNKGQVTDGADLNNSDILNALNGSLNIYNGTISANTFILTRNAGGSIHFPDATLQTTAAFNLAFTPVQQGGGTGQTDNHKVYIGYDGSKPRIQIDSTDFGQIVTLPNFLNFQSTTQIIEQLPDGTMIQAAQGINLTGVDVISFPNQFPTTCVQVIACERNPAGWLSGAHPTVFGTQDLNKTSFTLYVTQWNPTTGTWGLNSGISYRYIAIGY